MRRAVAFLCALALAERAAAAEATDVPSVVANAGNGLCDVHKKLYKQSGCCGASDGSVAASSCFTPVTTAVTVTRALKLDMTKMETPMQNLYDTWYGALTSELQQTVDQTTGGVGLPFFFQGFDDDPEEAAEIFAFFNVTSVAEMVASPAFNPGAFFGQAFKEIAEMMSMTDAETVESLTDTAETGLCDPVTGGFPANGLTRELRNAQFAVEDVVTMAIPAGNTTMYIPLSFMLVETISSLKEAAFMASGKASLFALMGELTGQSGHMTVVGPSYGTITLDGTTHTALDVLKMFNPFREHMTWQTALTDPSPMKFIITQYGVGYGTGASTQESSRVAASVLTGTPGAFSARKPRTSVLSIPGFAYTRG